MNGNAICVPNEQPASETCNGLDDNCDGAVDEGCPIGVFTGADWELTGFGGVGGSPFKIECPTGTMMVGVDLRWGSHRIGQNFVDVIHRVQGVCQDISLQEDTTATPYTYTLEPTGPEVTTAAVGGTGGTGETFRCNTPGFLNEMQLRTGRVVEQMRLQCSEAALSGYPSSPSTSPTDTDSATYGGTGGTLQTATRCEDNQFFAGFHGSAGDVIELLGPICRDFEVDVR